MKSYPKKIKKLIREYMTEVYDRELHRELSKLEVSKKKQPDYPAKPPILH